MIDKNEFKNEIFQCVFQYLRRFDKKEDLSSFLYRKTSVEGNYLACISTIQKYVLYLRLDNVIQYISIDY